MSRIFSTYLAVLTLAFLSGCSSVPYMPLTADNPKPDASKPLYLMTVVLKNDYRKRWQPRVLHVLLKQKGTTEKIEGTAFRMDAQGVVDATEEGGSTTYLVRFTTDGSPATIEGLNAMASAFPVHGYYFVPLHSPVPKFSSGVYYLGAVQAVIRERKDNEFRAGPVIPLIDQAIAGASSGTFDIVIGDSYSSDIKIFKKAFPALKDLSIVKAVLAPWDKAKAQSAWEKN